jgi:curved DNA-binding protein CbpA
MKDFYYILGTDANCGIDEIKDAYRKLSKKFHPDLNQGDKYFEDRFREIKEAYETLSDPGKRLRYDAALKSPQPPPSTGNNKKSGDYGQQTSNQQYQSRPAAFTKPRTKGPGVGMTLTLVLIGLVLGVYLVESFSSSKTNKTRRAPAHEVVPVKTVKHRKRKHNPINIPTHDSAVHKMDTTGSKVTRPVANTKKQPSTSIKKQPIPINNDSADHNGSYLYATYVQPNATGVVNMRERDSYNSAVIATVPANSKVYVIGRGSFYYKVLFNSNVGYVPKWSLQSK